MNQTKIFIKDDTFLINMRDLLHCNVLQTMDYEFIKFIKAIDEGWRHYATINDDHTPVF